MAPFASYVNIYTHSWHELLKLVTLHMKNLLVRTYFTNVRKVLLLVQKISNKSWTNIRCFPKRSEDNRNKS